ncbi:LysM peptidoglycan-binding domain-containing protein [Methylocapsa aurea]|uniref:LysM peptidoglycan-binding domain-containing protein n=1 Tax=Methylocapsa aurea TaxID=663610 RepID=UPI00068E48E9|nr:LysM peptidoglycan-binding domain-containing protein [Methylocapsa aurea]
MHSKAIALPFGFCFALAALVGSGVWPLFPLKPKPERQVGAQDLVAPLDAAGESVSLRAARPLFDFVRVEPSGAALVAGRASPGARVALMAGGAALAEASADSAGLFALQPKPLAPGDHVLTLRAGDKRTSVQSVTVSVPEKGKGQVMAALAEPGKATILFADPTAAAGEVRAAPRVAFKTVEVEPDGGFFASGIANPGALIRLYLDENSLAAVTAGPDGRWSVKLAKSLGVGHYALRADEIDSFVGAVASRAEIPFDVPASMAPARTQPPAARADVSGSRIGTEPVETATVQRGDSLWRISQKMFGKGVRYTQIYSANSAQIRDPRKIYPGQVLVLPKDR